MKRKPQFQSQEVQQSTIDFSIYAPLIEHISSLTNPYGSDSSTERIIIAIDGRCASGKSSLAAYIASVFDCNVFHMDDFFLQPHQRTDARLAQPGGNVDYERFYEEILLPLKTGGEVSYRPYDCSSTSLLEPVAVPAKKLNIVEGSYSMHPHLINSYDFKVLLSITPDVQLERLRRRSSPQVLARFIEKWIPLEEMYFKAFDLTKTCDFVFCQ